MDSNPISDALALRDAANSLHTASAAVSPLSLRLRAARSRSTTAAPAPGPTPLGVSKAAAPWDRAARGR